MPDSPLDSNLLLTNHAPVASVFRFNRTTQAFDCHHRIPGSGLFGSAFDLPPGVGYVVKCEAPLSFTVSGAPDPSDTLVGLVTGFHFAGMKPPGGATVRSLLEVRPDLASIFCRNKESASFAVTEASEADSLGLGTCACAPAPVRGHVAR